MGGPTFHAFYTLLVFAVIIIVIVWAYSSKNKKRFDRDARMIFDDEEQQKRSDHKRESDKDE